MKKAAYIFILVILTGLLSGVSPAMAVAPPDGTDQGCTPRLSTTSAYPYWASYSDYHNRVLTVDEKLQNEGGCIPCPVRIDGIEADNGVTVDSPLPVDMGFMPAGASIKVRYRVPSGVARFHRHLRAVCGAQPGDLPETESRLTIDPEVAYANQGCPLPGSADSAIADALPEDRHYGPRRFTVRLVNEDGTPASGKQIKWYLSDDVSFRMLESTTVTDGNGEAYAVVTPPLYFTCIAPYFDRSSTAVGAISEDEQTAVAMFYYTRCVPDGAEPPWAVE